MEFPLTLTDGFKTIAVVISEGFTGRGLLALEQRKERQAVDLVFRLRGCAGFDDCRDDIDISRERIRAGVGFHDARPADDERHADTAFESRTFAFAERAGGAGMASEVQPGAVVAGKDNDGVLINTLVFECLEHGTDGAIDIGHRIGIRSNSLALEVRRGAERGVRHRGREVEEERLVLASALLNETNRAQALHRGQLIHTHPVAYDTHRNVVHIARQLGIHLPTSFVADSVAQWPHVVRIRQDHRIVEAVLRREEFRRIAQMPLTDHTGPIAGIAQQGAERLFVVAEPGLRLRTEGGTAQTETIRITTSKERHPRRSADGLGRVETGEAQAFFGQSIDVWRHVLGRSVAAWVSPTHVIAHDIHYVRTGAEQGRTQE